MPDTKLDLLKLPDAYVLTLLEGFPATQLQALSQTSKRLSDLVFKVLLKENNDEANDQLLETILLESQSSKQRLRPYKKAILKKLEDPLFKAKMVGLSIFTEQLSNLSEKIDIIYFTITLISHNFLLETIVLNRDYDTLHFLLIYLFPNNKTNLIEKVLGPQLSRAWKYYKDTPKHERYKAKAFISLLIPLLDDKEIENTFNKILLNLQSDKPVEQATFIYALIKERLNTSQIEEINRLFNQTINDLLSQEKRTREKALLALAHMPENLFFSPSPKLIDGIIKNIESQLYEKKPEIKTIFKKIIPYLSSEQHQKLLQHIQLLNELNYRGVNQTAINIIFQMSNFGTIDFFVKQKSLFINMLIFAIKNDSNVQIITILLRLLPHLDKNELNEIFSVLQLNQPLLSLIESREKNIISHYFSEQVQSIFPPAPKEEAKVSPANLDSLLLGIAAVNASDDANLQLEIMQNCPLFLDFIKNKILNFNQTDFLFHLFLAHEFESATEINFLLTLLEQSENYTYLINQYLEAINNINLAEVKRQNLFQVLSSHLIRTRQDNWHITQEPANTLEYLKLSFITHNLENIDEIEYYESLLVTIEQKTMDEAKMNTFLEKIWTKNKLAYLHQKLLPQILDELTANQIKRMFSQILNNLSSNILFSTNLAIEILTLIVHKLDANQKSELLNDILKEMWNTPLLSQAQDYLNSFNGLVYRNKVNNLKEVLVLLAKELSASQIQLIANRIIENLWTADNLAYNTSIDILNFFINYFNPDFLILLLEQSLEKIKSADIKERQKAHWVIYTLTPHLPLATLINCFFKKINPIFIKENTNLRNTLLDILPLMADIISKEKLNSKDLETLSELISIEELSMSPCVFDIRVLLLKNQEILKPFLLNELVILIKTHSAEPNLKSTLKTILSDKLINVQQQDRGLITADIKRLTDILFLVAKEKFDSPEFTTLVNTPFLCPDLNNLIKPNLLSLNEDSITSKRTLPFSNISKKEKDITLMSELNKLQWLLITERSDEEIKEQFKSVAEIACQKRNKLNTLFFGQYSSDTHSAAFLAKNFAENERISSLFNIDNQLSLKEKANLIAQEMLNSCDEKVTFSR